MDPGIRFFRMRFSEKGGSIGSAHPKKKKKRAMVKRKKEGMSLQEGRAKLQRKKTGRYRRKRKERK